MSVAANAVAQMPIGADAQAASTAKTPPKRTATAKSDPALQPESR